MKSTMVLLSIAVLAVYGCSDEPGSDGEVGQVALEQTALTLGEFDCTVSVTVARTGGSDGRASVAYSTADGTAVAGTDYDETSGTLVWEDGDSSAKEIRVPIHFDLQASTDKAFEVRLDQPEGATLGNAATGVTVENRTCSMFEGNIDTDTTLTGHACYEVDHYRRSINAGELTIEPGAVLVFGDDFSLTTTSTGHITARGTAECPVVFTAEQQQTGYWRGLNLSGNDTVLNTLEHVVIEYAGIDDYTPGNVSVDSGARAVIDHTTLRHSSTYGFWVEDGALLESFTENTIVSNMRAGYIFAINAHLLDASSTYVGNDEDYVVVHNYGSHADVTGDVSWQGLDAAYYVDASFSIHGTLTIEPGARLIIANGSQLTVSSTGTLSAIGTEDEPVVFTGPDDLTPGQWVGIHMMSDPDKQNSFTHSVIECAGNDSYHPANLVLHGDAKASITDTTLRYSSNYGLWLDGAAELTAFTDNVLTENVRPAHVYASSAAHLDGSSTYSNNSEDVVVVTNNGSHNDVVEDGTWPALDADYLVDASFSVYAELTLEAGARLQFMEDIALYVGTGGRLVAVGTSDNEIELTAALQQPGGWTGLRIAGGPDVTSVLEHVNIEYGGSHAYEPANLTVLYDSRADLNEVRLTNSAMYGLWLSDEGVLERFSDNTLTNNERPARVYANTADELSSSSSFTGNYLDVVIMSNYGSHADVQDNTTWPALDVPYLVDASIGVHADLFIDAGAELRFAPDTALNIHSTGQLTAVNVTFTGELLWDGQTGNWVGIRIMSAGTKASSLTTCTVEYAGTDSYKPALVTAEGNANVTVFGCQLNNSAGHGLWKDRDATLSQSKNSFSNITGEDVHEVK